MEFYLYLREPHIAQAVFLYKGSSYCAIMEWLLLLCPLESHPLLCLFRNGSFYCIPIECLLFLGPYVIPSILSLCWETVSSFALQLYIIEFEHISIFALVPFFWLYTLILHECIYTHVIYLSLFLIFTYIHYIDWQTCNIPLHKNNF